MLLGPLLKKILEDSLTKRDGTLQAERKIFLYSAHDYTVGVLLRALDVFYPHVPPYGSTIFFEIHNIDGKYGLKVTTCFNFSLLLFIFCF